MYEKQIVHRDEGQRLDKYLLKILPNASASFLYKMLRKKNITLNKKKASGSEKLSAGDVIQIYFSDETLEKFMGHSISAGNGLSAQYKQYAVEVIYEDADYLFLNKPAGMLSQKAESDDYSINEWIIDYLLSTEQLLREDLQSFRPSICNRLDRNTSGLVLAAKSIKGAQYLSEQLAKRSAEKYYLTIVEGVLQEPVLLKGYLQKDTKTNKVRVTKDTGSYIETAYTPLYHTDSYTLLKVHLITGKSHQIRAHLASIGYPILGDRKYNGKKETEKLADQFGLQYQLLHAYQITFPQRDTESNDSSRISVCGKTFYAALPKQFQEVLQNIGYPLSADTITF